ncbi:MAG: hypothetical protein PHQ23_00790 [Candidatus Wallbacteria bacterium]|nr:hypothetical protein [Candidatus Wallbacteria bacterium]
MVFIILLLAGLATGAVEESGDSLPADLYSREEVFLLRRLIGEIFASPEILARFSDPEIMMLLSLRFEEDRWRVIEHLWYEVFNSPELLARFTDQEIMQILVLKEKYDVRVFELKEVSLEKDLDLSNRPGIILEDPARPRSPAAKKEVQKVSEAPASRSRPVIPGFLKSCIVSRDLRIVSEVNEHASASPRKTRDGSRFDIRLGINMGMELAEDVTAAARVESYGEKESGSGYWNPDFLKFDNCEARIDIRKFPGDNDLMRLGRQKYMLAESLLGRDTADGLTLERKFDGGKYKGRVGAFRFNYGRDHQFLVERDGPDMLFTELSFNIREMASMMQTLDNTFRRLNLDATLYSASMRNPFRESAAAGYSGLFDPGAGKYDYYGFSLGNSQDSPVRLWGEYSLLRWREELRLADELSRGGEAFLVGMKCRMLKAGSFRLTYTKLGENFLRPAVWESRTYQFPVEENLPYQAGYYSNFGDLSAEMNYNLSRRVSLIARYESIDDRRSVKFDELTDDRDIYTGIFNYHCNEDAVMRFSVRKVDCRDGTGTAMVNQATSIGDSALGSDVTGFDKYGRQIGVDDASTVRLEMELKI